MTAEQSVLESGIALTEPGQINIGDKVSFMLGGCETRIAAIARWIINPGTEREEVIYNRAQNHYFITRMAIAGESSHKDVRIEVSPLAQKIISERDALIQSQKYEIGRRDDVLLWIKQNPDASHANVITVIDALSPPQHTKD